MGKALISPTYRHIFGSGGVEAEVTSIRGRHQVQRTMIRFAPLTIRADSMIPGSITATEHYDHDEEEQTCHGPLTPDVVGSSFSARASSQAVDGGDWRRRSFR